MLFSKMYKLAAVITLFLSSLFIVTNANASLIDLNNDDDFRNSNLLISYGGGGGGGNSPKDKAKKKAKKEKAKLTASQGS